MNSANPVPSQQVSIEEVLRIAELAQLELTPEEQTGMLRDLNAILGHVAQLNELDTADVPAMAQINEVLNHALDDSGNDPPDGSGSALRSDVLRASLDRAHALAGAPETDGIYFKVPKVIER